MIHDLLTSLVWYLIVTGFGAIALPVSMTVFRRLPDGGILLARPLGWLLVAFFSWWLAYLHILPFTRWGIGLIGMALFSLSIVLLKKRPAWFQRKWRLHWRTARNGEILSILAFLLILMARREDPNINSTEKPMDAMMLNSLVVARYIPPPDAWLAGHSINYHYGGYLLHAIPIKLTGIHPEIGYNLAFPLVAMLGVGIAFVLGRALFGRCRWAALTPVCIFFVGNLAGVSGFLERLSFPPNLHDWRFGFLWNTSRVIFDPGGSTINEYPFFSILWGDLHPHFSNIPFLLFSMAAVFALLRAILSLSASRVFRYEWPLLAVIAISCAYTLPTNVFDFPVMALFFESVIFAGILYRLWNAERGWKPVIPLFALMALPIAGYALALPFWAHFVPPDQGTQVKISPDHSSFMQFLLVFGLHTAASLGFLFLRGSRMALQWTKEELGLTLALSGILFLALWAKFGYIVCALAPCVALAFWLLAMQTAFQKKPARNSYFLETELFALIACALAWSLIAGCEFIYLKDNYGIARMNTLFKFHFPAWFLLGLGLPYLLYHDYQRIEKRSAYPWFFLLPILGLFLVTLIPPIYTLAWIYQIPGENRPVTLDGLAFLRNDRPHQYAILEWIRSNTKTSDRILEVPGCGYLLESTVSAFTGRPSVVGWVGHESLWRTGGLDAEVYNRKSEAERFFTTQNWDEAKDILKKYQIRYVIYIRPECDDKRALIGAMEKGIYRDRLKPIVAETGSMGYPFIPCALYEVPGSL